MSLLPSWPAPVLGFCLMLWTPAHGAECPPQTFAGALDGEVVLCQNWGARERQEFWFLSQGSQIIPLRWFLALERADGGEPFNDRADMDRFRYLPQQPTSRNPFGLPIGFTVGSARGNPEYAEVAAEWLGLTCAACHANRIDFGGRKMLIDGAPAMADFQGFMAALADALQATLDQPAKFDRFAGKVLGAGEATERNRAILRRRLAVMTEIRRAWNERNAGSSPYGFARVDALGAIFNAVAATAASLPGNAQPADAPVSYPFIWDTPHHDRVQWNGSVANAGSGALGRNVGEALGVFGSISLNTRRIIKDGHETSVDIPNLGRLEELLWSLRSPRWPETILPEIDDDLAEAGRPHFQALCQECHAQIERDDPGRRIEAVLTPLDELGTDRAMAANFAERRYASGALERHFTGYLRGPRFGEAGSGGDFLTFAVTGTIFYDFVRDPAATLRAINAGRPGFFLPTPRDLALAEAALPDDLSPQGAAAAPGAPPPEKDLVCRSGEKFFDLDLDCGAATVPAEPAAAPAPARAPEPQRIDDSQLAYKARPMNGIWATGPYLHNGSVRTLADLLLPPDQRPATFRIGSREFDPDNVGFVDAGDFLFDTSLPGNANAGHDYGTGELSDAERDALLEYLKTL